MTNKTHVGFLLMMLAAALAGCDGASPTAPAALPPQTATATPAPPTPSGPGYKVADFTLSGVVFEMTPTGPVPIEGARVYLSDDQDILTDANGLFSFTPVWVCPCSYHYWLAADHTIIWVGKDGYDDTPGQAQLPGLRGPGWRVVPIYGDMRFDVELVRR